MNNSTSHLRLATLLKTVYITATACRLVQPIIATNCSKMLVDTSILLHSEIIDAV